MVWRNSKGTLRLYVWGEEDYMRAFRFDGVDSLEQARVAFEPPRRVYRCGMLSLSSNGSAEGSAIVWASLPWKDDANAGTVEGVLHAFDAEDIGKEVWNSKRNQARDRLGMFAKFCPPVVANGKVYMATFAEPANAGQAVHPNKLVVYGILP